MPAARRLAWLLTGDRGLGEDLAHDAFVRVAARAALRDQEAFGVYLKRAVVNAVHSHFRNTRVVRIFELDARGVATLVHDSIWDLSPVGLDPVSPAP